MAEAIARAAPLPRKVKLAPQFNGIAPIQESPRKSSFCHAEHGQLTMLALPIRRVCHANESAGREADTGNSVSSGLVTRKAAAAQSHPGGVAEVTDRSNPIVGEEVRK